jgi:ERF superfamily
MNILKKIIAVQDAMEPIKKNKTNTHFKNTYFGKDTLLGILDPILKEQGLRLFHPLTDIGGRPAMKMLFVDMEDMEEYSFTFPMPDLQDAQKMGGAMTYYVRYTLVTFLGLESEDDDGNKAGTVSAPKAPVSAPVPVQSAQAPQMAQSTKHCAVCNKEFIPPAGFPNTRCCTGFCGNAYKKGARYVAPEALPAIQQEVPEGSVNLEDIPF